MRTDAPGQSALLMLDVAATLSAGGIAFAVIGAMAAAVHGAVRASLDADAVLRLTIHEAMDLRRKLDAMGLVTELRTGDPDDPIPAVIAASDPHGNRVDLLVGLRGLDPDAFSRVQRIAFFGESLPVIGREDFIAMKAFAGGPLDLADARAAIADDPQSLDLELLERLARRFGPEATRRVQQLLGSP